MLWRYVKAQGMVLLCGGLVGPIFLGVYFATGQSDLMRWMFWVGVLVTAVDVLAALAIVGYGAKAQAKSDQLEAHGVLGLAQIIGMAETNTRINDRPVVRLNLRISGPGIATFDAEDRVIADVTRLAMLTARRLAVLVDPATGEFQIDWERTALINGQVPATFSIAEDNTTYDLSGQAEPLMEILQILKANGIGMNSMVDLRNNPGARAQVQAVVRRAAAQQAAPQAPPAAAYPPAPAGVYPPPIPEPSTAQRLQELETLRATGAISDDEYADKRRQIIAEL
ncbi:SHOCT domain-containing protein [Mycolicibacterium frederiksbergense]|uniref:SHOCT domain-containing protein n=1 Tax=Mycolicibacterium frederiksbergense TaxID=117567 RepID=A0A6H0S446_9MYCO|nr:SHOCT domain-containing protein [Mycolicibacterium frederiksbergense]QIV81105.1 SHOCT domain-containing protein [Mycolicibacterium frederiksbergense]